MAHYAKVSNNIVTNIIVAEPEFFKSFLDDTPGEWIQTSYNTRGGVHSDGGIPLRKNYASIGDVYDDARDAFYKQQPFESWTLDDTTCEWSPPVPYPEGMNEYAFYWDEPTTSWVEVTE